MARKPQFKDNQKVKGGVLKRSRRRARRLIAADKIPKGVSPRGGISGREARALKRASAQLPRRQSKPQQQPFNPLAPLTGDTFNRELKAVEGYEFGDQQRGLEREGRRLQQVYADTGSYYDAYKDALAKAVAGIRGAADSTAATVQTAADTSYAQDKARQEARDAEEAAIAARFGRPATPSQEGQRAVEARNFMAQAEASRMRERGLERVGEAQLNEPLALLSKAQQLGRVNQRIAANVGDQQALTKQRGQFRTKYRADIRDSEREWEAIKKEFRLKEADTKADNNLRRAELKVEKLKSFNQLKQAILYAGADRAMARAIVKQAKTMADAKIISAQQYREIANINKSASDRRAKSNENVAKTNQRGGGGGEGRRNLQPWEQDRVDRAKQALNRVNSGSIKVAHNGHGWTSFVRRMRRFGITPQYSRIAWDEYWRSKKKGRSGGQPGANFGGPRND